MSFYEGKPNLVDWRSQDLGSIGQPNGDEDLSLAGWAQKCVKKRNLDQLVATEIKGEISPKCLKEFSQVAFRCLHSDPKERPTMSEVVVALQLTLALQEKFDSCAKPRGLAGFTLKIPSYFVLPRKEESGHSDEKPSSNNENNSDCSLSQTEASGDYYPDNEQTRAQDIKIFSYTDLKCATSNFQHE
ncbi:serine/threonine/dual specificity protein kinase, catalytic domain-containing protein, partial [Tanacetum coccineum]